MLSQAEYQALVARVQTGAHPCYTVTHEGKAYSPDGLAPINRLTNEETSALELYEFVTFKPSALFAYVHLEKPSAFDAGDRYITTWQGDRLGTITYIGYAYRSNFGDTRRSIKIRAINGLIYSGTYYESSGDYCRVRALKSC